MQKPNEDMDWAEAPGAQTSEPVNERAAGFPYRYVLPSEQINWLWRAVGRWIAWLAFQLRTFDSLDEFVAGTSPGEVAVVSNYDPDERPGGIINAVLAGGRDVYADARYMLLAGEDNVTIRERRDLASTVGTLGAAGGAFVVYKIRGNGRRLLVSSIDPTPGSITRIVECFDYSNPAAGVLLWTVPAAPSDGHVGIAITGRWAFIAENFPSATVSMYDLTTGALLSTFMPDDDIVEIAACGDSVYIVRFDSIVQKLEFEASALVSRWGISVSSYGGENALVCDDRRVYLVHGATSVQTNWLTVIAAGGSIERNAYEWTPIAETGGAHVAIDEHSLYIARSHGILDVVDKRSAGVVRRTYIGGSYTAAVSTDGDGVAVTVFYAFDSSYVTTVYASPKQTPRRYLRVDANNYLPYQKLAIELGE